jgi:hypothetical protein
MGNTFNENSDSALRWPNDRFYDRYHKKESPHEKSLLDKSQLILVRHAYSEFNNAWIEYCSSD